MCGDNCDQLVSVTPGMFPANQQYITEYIMVIISASSIILITHTG